MREAVRLKGFPHGIQVLVDENASMAEILEEITKKFAGSEKFFGKGERAVLLEGQSFSREQEEKILERIESTCGMKIACMISKQPNEDIEKLLQSREPKKEEEKSDGAQFFRGNIRHRDVLEMKDSVIILGNVESGGRVISQKNIIVLGRLSGNAYAGADGNPHFVAALSMDPEQVRIGDAKGRLVQKSKLLKRGNDKPKIAYRRDDEIVFSDIEITDELLQNIM